MRTRRNWAILLALAAGLGALIGACVPSSGHPPGEAAIASSSPAGSSAAELGGSEEPPDDDGGVASTSGATGDRPGVGPGALPPAAMAAPVFVSAADALGAGAQLVDARPAAAFWLGHAPGAVRLAWDELSDPTSLGRLLPDRAELDSRLGAAGVASDAPIRVIGAWTEGWGEEGRLYWMFRVLGVSDVSIVEGGWAAWEAAGLPVERGPVSPTARAFVAGAPPSGTLATLDELGAADAIVDVREPPEFAGAVLYGEARGGHVPGARNVPWRSLLADDGSRLPAQEVAARVGAAPTESVVVYCTGGVRSAFAWALLVDAGFVDVANYAGSWWEYAATELPAE
ncbi:MAG: sulfurtransferase [Myxococcales bacterium]|nr:sulfurtransferase [Myxococcales bacterium]MCB9519949.1 sulfurtransferase [Myxococcales bacterium]MCB9533143.1 sulfurtransferase [Myxococcales bacterium]